MSGDIYLHFDLLEACQGERTLLFPAGKFRKNKIFVIGWRVCWRESCRQNRAPFRSGDFSIRG
jgi:hypothetical protein